jgi:hypothetical protein
MVNSNDAGARRSDLDSNSFLVQSPAYSMECVKSSRLAGLIGPRHLAWTTTMPRYHQSAEMCPTALASRRANHRAIQREDRGDAAKHRSTLCDVSRELPVWEFRLPALRRLAFLTILRPIH